MENERQGINENVFFSILDDDMSPENSLISMFDNEEMCPGGSDSHPTNLFVHSATALDFSETSTLADMFDNEAETDGDIEALVSGTRQPSSQHPSSASQQLMEDFPVRKIFLASPHSSKSFPSVQEGCFKESNGIAESIEEYLETDSREEKQDLNEEIPYYNENLRNTTAEGGDAVMSITDEDRKTKYLVENISYAAKKVDTVSSLNTDDSVIAHTDKNISLKQEAANSTLDKVETLADGKNDKMFGDGKKNDAMGVEKNEALVVTGRKHAEFEQPNIGKTEVRKTNKDKKTTNTCEEDDKSELRLKSDSSNGALTNRRLRKRSLETKYIVTIVKFSIRESLVKLMNHSTDSDCLLTLCVRNPISGSGPRQIQIRATAKQVENGKAKRAVLKSRGVASQNPIGVRKLEKKQPKRHINAMPGVATLSESAKITWTQKKGSSKLTPLHAVPTFYKPSPTKPNPRELAGLARLQKYNIQIQPKAIERIKRIARE